MSDNPPAHLIVTEVRKALEQGIASGFPQKVAANALGIAQRELENGPAMQDDEAKRLCAAIDAGDVDDALIARLIEASIAKMEIDQPSYPGFAAWRDRR